MRPPLLVPLERRGTLSSYSSSSVAVITAAELSGRDKNPSLPSAFHTRPFVSHKCCALRMQICDCWRARLSRTLEVCHVALRVPPSVCPCVGVAIRLPSRRSCSNFRTPVIELTCGLADFQIRSQKRSWWSGPDMEDCAADLDSIWFKDASDDALSQKQNHMWWCVCYHKGR